MPYSPPYPGGWEDFPNTTTPITAAALDAMDTGITDAQDDATQALSDASAAQSDATQALSDASAAQATADAASIENDNTIIAARIFT